MVRWDKTPSCLLHDTEKGCVFFRVYLRVLKVELQSGPEKDSNLELASQQTRGVGSRAEGANFPALGIESVMPPKFSWLH